VPIEREMRQHGGCVSTMHLFAAMATVASTSVLVRFLLDLHGIAFSVSFRR